MSERGRKRIRKVREVVRLRVGISTIIKLTLSKSACKSCCNKSITLIKGSSSMDCDDVTTRLGSFFCNFNVKAALPHPFSHVFSALSFVFEELTNVGCLWISS
jgi:hypothetical protein